MAKHSAGEWEVEHHDDREQGEWYSVDGPDGPILDTLNCNHCCAPDEQLANAQLAAAGPKLLAACERLVKAVETPHFSQPDYEYALSIAREAISTAGGQVNSDPADVSA